MKEPQVIEIGGTVYLGIIEEEKRVNSALDCKNIVERGDLRRWLKADNLSELDSIVLSKVQGFSVKPLSRDLKRHFQAYVAEFAEIKEYAIQMLQNSLFDERQ